MIKILTTIAACAFFGTGFAEIDGSYMHLTSFALGSFLFGLLLSNEL